MAQPPHVSRGSTGRIVAAAAFTAFCSATLRPSAASPSGSQPAHIIELRQYTLHPGQRDVLIDLFEREFVESQEALGMAVVGTFRDLDRPDRFVWIRGFADMASRAEGLEAFYGGPVWKAHRNAANATMLDSDNVLLLREAGPGSGFNPDPGTRAPKGASAVPGGLIVANLYYFDGAVGADFVDYFDHTVKPALKKARLTVRASYFSEPSPNNFPRLPVRERDRVFVWFAVFPSLAEYERRLATLSSSTDWQRISRELQQRLKASPETLRLEPTPRSALHE